MAIAKQTSHDLT